MIPLPRERASLSLAVFMVLGLSGCGANAPRATPDPQLAGASAARTTRVASAPLDANAALGRVLAEAAAQAAVAIPGVKVCRQLRLGIAELDWIRGTVVEVAGGRVGVRIDDPGQFAHILHGAAVERGTLLWDAPVAWTPCV